MQKHICSEWQTFLVKVHDISITHRLAMCVCPYADVVKSFLLSAHKNHFLQVAWSLGAFVPTCLKINTSQQSVSTANINVIHIVCLSECEFSWRVVVFILVIKFEERSQSVSEVIPEGDCGVNSRKGMLIDKMPVQLLLLA